MENSNKKEQLALFELQKQMPLAEYIENGNWLSDEEQLLLFEHPDASDMVISYIAKGHVLSQEAMLRVFSFEAICAQCIMEVCIAYEFPLNREIQLKLFELKDPKAAIRRFIRQNKGTNRIDSSVYQKAKALRYI